VANLAVSFAHYGMRVLLIDADVRRPSVHRALGVARTPGLMQYLAGHASFAETIHATTLPNLHVLPAGSLQDGSNEPFGDPRVGELLTRAARDYDVVLLDSAPVLLSSDAAILAAHCDSAVLVVRAGNTNRDAARHALRQLHAVRASVVGAVLNDPDNRAIHSGGYHAAYGYGYGAGYGVRPLETAPVTAPVTAPPPAPPAPLVVPTPVEPPTTRLTGHMRPVPPRATTPLVPRGSGVGIADAILAVRARAAAEAAAREAE
jgi:capsular exopolysaccharide synthesis family protein